MTTVLLGDSLTVGTGARYRLLDPRAIVIARVGATISWMSDQPLPAGALVLLMGGTNDLMSASGTIVASRMQALVQKLRSAGHTVIVGTIPYLRNRDTERRNYNMIIGRDLGAVNIGGDLQESYIGPDGVHPGPAGYDIMAKRWFEVARYEPSKDRGPSMFSMALGALLLLGGAYYVSTTSPGDNSGGSSRRRR